MAGAHVNPDDYTRNQPHYGYGGTVGTQGSVPFDHAKEPKGHGVGHAQDADNKSKPHQNIGRFRRQGKMGRAQ